MKDFINEEFNNFLELKKDESGYFYGSYDELIAAFKEYLINKIVIEIDSINSEKFYDKLSELIR